MHTAVHNPLTVSTPDTVVMYTTLNSSSMTSITLNGTDVLGDAFVFVVVALPRLVSSYTYLAP